MTIPPGNSPHPKTNREAWAVYHHFIAFPNIQLLAEPAGTDTCFQSLTTQSPLPHRLWTDAYLAAFAIAGGLRLVSLDTDFAGFIDYKSNEGPRTFCLLERITGYDYFAAYRHA